MAFGVNHDVSVVTIFELEEIRHDRVRSHACDEVVPGLSSALDRFDKPFGISCYWGHRVRA